MQIVYFQWVNVLQKSKFRKICLSEDAVQPAPEEIPYCVCKAALNLAKYDLQVITVSPAFIATSMTDAKMKKRSN
ncbi:hypothetical protein CSQ79_19970 [Gloeocapsopsis sp. IPPAS B-1203]|nr:hypothetical protein CSQ79_19970 [Gloeocapsopsis sp. IPPAS B-1203]